MKINIHGPAWSPASSRKCLHVVSRALVSQAAVVNVLLCSKVLARSPSAAVGWCA